MSGRNAVSRQLISEGHFSQRHRIDVGTVDLVAGHGPAEGVIRRAAAGSDRIKLT
jgi:hypothetical protein